jgi:hypothetical protein
MREGFSNYHPIAALEAMAKQRSAEARGGELHVDDLLPPSPEEAKRRGLTGCVGGLVIGGLIHGWRKPA